VELADEVHRPLDGKPDSDKIDDHKVIPLAG
jgi:hypothetical protein